jgi:hypothetical protein
VNKNKQSIELTEVNFLENVEGHHTTSLVYYCRDFFEIFLILSGFILKASK